jgi:CDP-6-deoxy-D-xylo-4-hexulose-3-dehydrase
MIRLIKSTFYHEVETKHALADFLLEHQAFSMNGVCRKFEEAFAAKQGRKYAVYVNNGSVANLLLIQSMLNLGKFNRGDKIGFSALTWPTNVMPLIQLGLKPVAIDCNLQTLNISPQEVQNYINQIKGLFLTNVLGFCDDLPRIAQLCEEHSIPLLEDNCESLGSRANGKLLGNFGLASTFSFFVGHHISTIEGGMICTDDDELHNQLLMGRAHGWDRNLDTETQQELRTSSGTDAFYARYTFHDLAFNFRPTEINGFIGNTQIQYWDEIVERRVSNFRRFLAAMNRDDDYYHYKLSHMDVPSNFSMPIICKTPELAHEYRTKFSAAEVEVRPIIAGNITKQPFYRKYIRDTMPKPNSDIVHSNGFYFGNNPEMTEAELSKLCDLVGKD